MSGARVQFERVAKRYGAVVALEPTELVIEPGSFFALLGPSGSGKSTLLGTVAGFVPPSAGLVRVDGVDITGVPPHRRNIGMVFQNYSLFPYMSVFRNIAFPLEMRRVSKARIAERVERMLSMVQLSDLADRLPSQLSGGQQQRVALARAAVYDPPLLLMDEPLGALDKNLREEMQQEIKQFHAQVGATVIYVTHDQQEAAAMADRMAILNRGRVEQCGAPQALYEAPRNSFIARFLGEANLFQVRRMDRANGHCAVETEEGLRLSAPATAVAGRDLVACVRPENIVLAPEPVEGANVFSGRVAEAVHLGGTVRYRVRLENGCHVTVRAPSGSGARTPQAGEAVHLAWEPRHTRLMPRD